jgi:nucleoside-diphosphate-sugar epimerase
VVALDERQPTDPAAGGETWLRVPVGGPFTSSDTQVLAEVTHLAHLADRMTVNVAPAGGRWTAYCRPVHDLAALIARLPSLRHVTFASSYMVYATPPLNPVTEDRRLGPANQYAWGKCAVESYLAGLPLQASSLRFAGIYGPGVPIDLGRAVTEAVRALVEDRPVDLYRPGTSLRKHLYIDEAAEAVCRSALEEWSGAFNVAGPDPVSVHDVVGELTRIARRPVPVRWHDGEPGWDAVMSTELIARRHGFRPVVSMSDGLRSYYEWATAADGALPV